MSKDHIKLHPEHGLNPAIPKCFVCGQDKNEIILAGAACRGQAPKGMVWDKNPCDKCEKLMEKGSCVIEVRDGEEKNKDNPYRTGRIWWIKKEAAKEVFGSESPVYFIEESAAKKVGLYPEVETPCPT